MYFGYGSALGSVDIVALAGTLAITGDPLGIIQQVPAKFAAAGTLDGGADLDGDGIPDMVCAVVDATTLIDRLDAFSGATGAVLYSIPAADSSDPFPASLRIMGDVNADGVVDIVAGSADNGYVRILSGNNGAFLNTISGSILDNFGECVDGAGDYNGDGLADVVIATQHALPWGHAQVYSAMSGALLGTITPAQPSLPYQAFRVAGLGDTNADGFGDFAYSTNEVVVGNPNTVRGRVRVVRGPAGVEAFSLLSGQTVDDFAFYEGSLRAGGDVNGDGFGDLIAGAVQFKNPVGTPMGKVWCYSGHDGASLMECIPPAGSTVTTVSHFGFAIDVIGDLDHDGTLDVFVGDSGGADAGAVGTDRGIIRAYSGGTGTLLKSLVGDYNGASIGGFVAPAGDMNANGLPDVLSAIVSNPSTSQTSIVALSTQCGGVLHYGSGCPAANGTIPTLTVTSGCPSPGVNITAKVTIPPFSQPAPAIVVVGPSSGSYFVSPGCSLLVGPPWISFPILVVAFNGATISGEAPYGVTQDFAIQAFLAAPGTPLGYSATRAAFVQID